MHLPYKTPRIILILFTLQLTLLNKSMASDEIPFTPLSPTYESFTISDIQKINFDTLWNNLLFSTDQNTQLDSFLQLVRIGGYCCVHRENIQDIKTVTQCVQSALNNLNPAATSTAHKPLHITPHNKALFLSALCEVSIIKNIIEDNIAKLTVVKIQKPANKDDVFTVLLNTGD